MVGSLAPPRCICDFSALLREYLLPYQKCHRSQGKSRKVALFLPKSGSYHVVFEGLYARRRPAVKQEGRRPLGDLISDFTFKIESAAVRLRGRGSENALSGAFSQQSESAEAEEDNCRCVGDDPGAKGDICVAAFE